MRLGSLAAMAVFFLVTICIFVLVWLNRGSEKILTAVIPIVIAALIGVVLAVFVFGGEPPVTEIFPSSFLYKISNKMPADLPWVLQSRRFVPMQFAPGELYKVRPEFFTDSSDPQGTMLYHHLLQKSMIDFLGMLYRGSWQTEILHFELPGFREQRFAPVEGSTEPTKVFTATEIANLLKGNKFAGINSGISPQIAVPPGTTLEILVPHRKNGGLEQGEILLKNWFFTVSIQTVGSHWMRSAGGYQQLAGISDQDAADLGTSMYTVRFKARFSRWLSGNPSMPKYKAWARQLADELRARFDEQVIWQKTKEDYLFLKETGALGAAK